MSTLNYARNSQRVSVTVPFHVHQRILALSDHQGRSMSNLMAYILERGLDLLFKDIDLTHLG
jgi:predicted DNA-binding protein